MAKSVGVGGIFLKARDPQALAAWYAAHLGIARSDDGSLVFQGPEASGTTVFALLPQNTAYFGDGQQPFMLNFRVDDLDQLLADLAASGVRIDSKREEHSYGRFAWIWAPEGNCVELWKPLPVR